METARTALERSPQDPELNMIVAEAMVAKNQFAEAEPFLMKSLNVKPQLLGHVHALDRKGLCRDRQNQRGNQPIEDGRIKR